MNLAEIMTRDVIVIAPDATLQEAAVKMREEDVGFLPVTDGLDIVGALTDRDLVVRGTAQGDHVVLTALTVLTVLTVLQLGLASGRRSASANVPGDRGALRRRDDRHRNVGDGDRHDAPVEDRAGLSAN